MRERRAVQRDIDWIVGTINGLDPVVKSCRRRRANYPVVNDMLHRALGECYLVLNDLLKEREARR